METVAAKNAKAIGIVTIAETKTLHGAMNVTAASSPKPGAAGAGATHLAVGEIDLEEVCCAHCVR